MKIIECAICGNSQNLQVLYKENLNYKKINKKTFSARRLPDRIHYEIAKCNKCGLVFSRRIFSDKKIVALYKGSDMYYSRESEYLGKTYFNYLATKVGNSKKLKVLDIGAGNGFFLERLVEEGISDVWGVEPGKPMIKKAKPYLKGRIIPDILKPGIFPKNSFDIICCFHTLDHIVDPNAFLKTVYQILKPGGKIFFVVHNAQGLSVKFFGERSPIFDVEHIYLFSPRTLKKIFTQNGFKRANVFSHYNTYPLSYWMHLVPLGKNQKKLLVSFLKKTKLGNLPIKINPGNIGIVAQK